MNFKTLGNVLWATGFTLIAVATGFGIYLEYHSSPSPDLSTGQIYQWNEHRHYFYITSIQKGLLNGLFWGGFVTAMIGWIFKRTSSSKSSLPP